MGFFYYFKIFFHMITRNKSLDKSIDYLKILGLSKTYSHEDLNSAYRQ
jgi:hypothetical protein